MRHALTTLAVVLIVAGFIRGWFAWTSTNKVPDSNKVDVNIRVDPDKIKEDAEEIKEKVEELEDKFMDESQDTAPESKPQDEPAP
ncbi:MAG: hypothetical protein ACM3U2_12115 [Deltaproteobacteria bacterium]|jgi:acetylornithine deacetylase/succinyl-diaminopimelate desuccinylase-like protein